MKKHVCCLTFFFLNFNLYSTILAVVTKISPDYPYVYSVSDVGELIQISETEAIKVGL